MTDLIADPAPGDPASPAGTSVYAELRDGDHRVPVHRLRKETLLALSWAIEDVFCTRAQEPVLFGAFQREEFLEPSLTRWEELAKVSRSAVAFAALDEGSAGTPPGSRLARVALSEGAAMRDEWTVVCDSETHAVVLAAVEAPDQQKLPERDRLFDALWTVDPATVRAASRACARVAHENGYAGAAPLLFHLAEAPQPAAVDPVAASAMFSEVVAYLDRFVGV